MLISLDSEKITAIIAVAAIISPIVTTIINNSHSSKLKKLELRQKHYEETVVYKRNIFENYIRCAGRFVKSTGWNESHDYKEAYFHALLYAPDSLRTKMIDVDSKIRTDEGSKALEALIPEIQHYIRQL